MSWSVVRAVAQSALNEGIVYRYPFCATASLEPLVEALLGSLQRQTRLAFPYGNVLTPAQLAGQYNLDVVLPSVEAAVGAAPTVGWLGDEEILCHNCQTWLFRAVVHYPAAQAVV